jgi:hypothetical protein
MRHYRTLGAARKRGSTSVLGTKLWLLPKIFMQRCFIFEIARSNGFFFFWIDAICINQKDSDERGQQVQFMAKIYNQAHRVIVWLGVELGVETLDSTRAFAALLEAANESTKKDLPYDADEATRNFVENPIDWGVLCTTL